MVRPQGRAPGETHSPEGRQPLIASGSVLSCWSQMPRLKPSPDSYCLHDLWLDPTQPLLCKTNTLQHCCEDNCVNTHEALKRRPGTLPPFGQRQLLSNTSLPYRLLSCASRNRLLGCLDSTYQKPYCDEHFQTFTQYAFIAEQYFILVVRKSFPEAYTQEWVAYLNVDPLSTRRLLFPRTFVNTQCQQTLNFCQYDR